MTATDEAFEAAVRAMLLRRAADLGDGPIALPDPVGVRRSPTAARRPVLAGVIAASAAVLAIVVASVALRHDGDRAQVSTDLDATRPRLPADFDLSRALTFFRADGTPEDVAVAYLRDRMPGSAPRLERQAAAIGQGLTSVRWTLPGDGRPGDPGEPVYTGEVVVREDGLGSGVVLATTDGLDLSGLSNDGTAIRGTIGSLLPDSFVVEVFAFSGPGGPGGSFTDGLPTAADLIESSGWVDPLSTPSFDVDVPVAFAPAVVRVRHEGGTQLSISELALDRPPHVTPGPSTVPGEGPYVVAEHDASDAVVGAIDVLFGPGLVTQLSELRGPAGVVELIDVTGTLRIEANVEVAEGGWRIHQLTTDGLAVELRPDGEAVARISSPDAVQVTARVLTAGGDQTHTHDATDTTLGPVDIEIPEEGWLATRVDRADGTVLLDLRPLDGSPTP